MRTKFILSAFLVLACAVLTQGCVVHSHRGYYADDSYGYRHQPPPPPHYVSKHNTHKHRIGHKPPPPPQHQVMPPKRFGNDGGHRPPPPPRDMRNGRDYGHGKY